MRLDAFSASGDFDGGSPQTIPATVVPRIVPRRTPSADILEQNARAVVEKQILPRITEDQINSELLKYGAGSFISLPLYHKAILLWILAWTESSAKRSQLVRIVIQRMRIYRHSSLGEMALDLHDWLPR